jgi:hypothetical protein
MRKINRTTKAVLDHINKKTLNKQLLMKKLIRVQETLKAPKGQFNNFGKYNYRNCEDILEAVKPLLSKEGLLLTITDELVNIGERYYIKATVTILDGKESISVSGYARESLVKKGMDESQITGTASSYARKYALNGMFLIDDTKDADSQDNRVKTVKPVAVKKPVANAPSKAPVKTVLEQAKERIPVLKDAEACEVMKNNVAKTDKIPAKDKGVLQTAIAKRLSEVSTPEVDAVEAMLSE